MVDSASDEIATPAAPRDRLTFTHLVERHKYELHVHCYRMLASVEDAEDMVQEAYLKLWDKRDSLDIRTNPAAYCISLVRHLCLDQMQTKHYTAQAPLPDDLALPADGDTGRRLEARDQWMHLRRLIARLPDTPRRVLWLRDVEECSMEEIGQATGLTEVNIRSILSRTRKKIREQFNRLTGETT